MSRNTILAVSVAALLAGGAVVATIAPTSFAAPETEPIIKQKPPSIRVVTAERRELVEKLSVTGTVVAREEAAAGTDLNGLTVTALNADIGDKVRKGDVLAVLDQSSLDAQLAQFEASRGQAEASIAQMDALIGDAQIGLRQAGETLERARALQQKGVAAKAQLDDAVNAADSARAKLLSAEKARAAAQAQLGVIDAQKRSILLQLDKTEVRAPADGLVLERNATLGGIVSAGSGPLFRIAIDGELELAATVAETALPKLAKGMKAEIAIAGASQAINGRIRRISPEIDRNSRLGSIRIALDTHDIARAGNFAHGEIEVLRDQAVAVPDSAVLFDGGKALLQVVEADRIKSVPVTLGVRADGFVEVKSGLAEGHEIVSRAGTFVADGDLVTPVREQVAGVPKP